MVFGCVITGLVGALLMVLGWLLWKRERISLLHDHHHDKVSPEHKTVFCALCGWGLLAMGIGLLVATVLLAVTESVWSFLAFAVGCTVGLPLLVYAERTYNRP